MTFDEKRQVEYDKYRRAYQLETYRMGAQRHTQAIEQLQHCYDGGCRTYLDVGTGRGEMLRDAGRMGFGLTVGTEVVDDLIDREKVVYGECHALPFNNSEFDLVSILDVLEHLVIGDEVLALQEVFRVARKFVILTTNNRPSANGEDNLHINLRDRKEWSQLMSLAAPFGTNLKYINTPTRQAFATWLWRAELP